MHIVVDYASKGGVSKVALKQALLLQAILVVLSKYRPWLELLSNIKHKYSRQLKLPILNRTVNILLSPLLGFGLLRNAKLVLAHQMSCCLYVMTQGVKYVAYIHDLHYSPIPITRFTKPLIQSLEIRALEKAELILTNSINTSQALKRLYGLNSIVIHPGVDVPPSIPWKRPRRILMVSRLSELKTMLPLATGLAKKLNCEVVIAGAWSRSIIGIKMPRNVRLIVDPEEHELTKLYMTSRVLVHMKPENFALPPLEAMACGTPPIVAKGCGVCQLFEHKIHGYKVKDWATLNDIIDTVEKILEDEWLKMGKNARKHVIEQDLTWEKHVKTLSNILKQHDLIRDNLFLGHIFKI